MRMFNKLLLICTLTLFTTNFVQAFNFGQALGDFARSEADRRNRENLGTDRGRWDSSDLVRSERTGDYSITRCVYKTLNGYDFSINIRNRGCPYRVYINPETNQVQIPN